MAIILKINHLKSALCFFGILHHQEIDLYRRTYMPVNTVIII